MTRFYNFFRDAVGREVAVDVRNSAFVEGEIIVDITEKHEGRSAPVPFAQLKMDKRAAARLGSLLAGVLALSGCSVIGGVCDQAQISVEYTHVSHPLAGAPFGPRTEEDALHTVGPVGRCDMGRAYVEGGLGYKVRDGGFYGPDLTGSFNVGVKLWELK